MAERPRNNRGGHRPGAGRPARGHTEILHMRITPEQKQWLAQRASENGRTVTDEVIAALSKQGLPS